MVYYDAKWAGKFTEERLSEYGKSPWKGLIECTVIVTVMNWSKIIKIFRKLSLQLQLSQSKSILEENTGTVELCESWPSQCLN